MDIWAIGKFLWLLAAPSSVLALSILIGLFLPFSKWRRIIAVSGPILFLMLLAVPMDQWLLAPLEDRFARFEGTDLEPVAIVVLGGGVDPSVTATRGDLAMTGAGERLYAALLASQTLPDIPIIVSGGSGDPLDPEAREAPLMKAALLTMGIQRSRIVVEDRSRNTYENALRSGETIERLGDSTGRLSAETSPVILITSAYHMPRAIGVFRAAGMNPVAYPTDYRTAARKDGTLTGQGPAIRLDLATIGQRLAGIDLAAREWVALTRYYASGWIDTWFPAPPQMQPDI